MLERVQQDLEQIPQRQVLDFLIQYFVNELNWMKQIVHPPSFLAQYQQWCTKERPLSAVSDIEFTVLVLRVCAYSAQFLPSPTETVERIRGIPLSDVRKICSELAERLAKPCLALDWKGSPVRVQHILFAALMSSCEGRTDKFWEQIGLASQAAQKAGLHADIYGPGDIAAQEGEREMRGRIFCCLYVLDRCVLECPSVIAVRWENTTMLTYDTTVSHLSRQLDRVPFLPDSLVADMLPKLRPVPELSSPGMDTSAPDEFTERLMQVQLGRFWRRLGSNRSVQYDPTQGEQRYERFCAEYLPTLPRAFALDPDIRWDKHRPKLAMQRQLLHVAIFDSVCWNFRPLLLLTEAQIASLPLYKRVLIQSQKIRLSMAALKELEAVTKLHAMFGGSQIRFSAIIFNTFEAAILLLCLASEAADGEMHQEEDSHEILGLQVRRHSRDEVMQEIEAALRRLRMLSDVSDMAASGAKVITQLLSQARRNIALPSTPTPTGLGSAAAWPDTFSTMLGTDYDSEISIFPEQSHESLMAGLLSDVGNQEYETDLQMSYNFPIP